MSYPSSKVEDDLSGGTERLASSKFTKPLLSCGTRDPRHAASEHQMGVLHANRTKMVKFVNTLL